MPKPGISSQGATERDYLPTRNKQPPRNGIYQEGPPYLEENLRKRSVSHHPTSVKHVGKRNRL